MGFFATLGAGLSAAAGAAAPIAAPIISGLFGLKQQDKANQAVSQTNDVNSAIAQQNLQFQRENLDYQKALQQQIFQREDSSYQRTVNDMRQAGISPLAMNGTNGAGEAISTTALNNDYKDSSYMKQFPNHVESALNTYSQLVALKQNQAVNDAQIRKINAEADSQDIENRFQKLDFAHRLAKSIMEKDSLSADYVGKLRANEFARLQNIMQGYLNSDAQLKNKYNKYFNLNSDMTNNERAGSIALKMSGFDLYDNKKGDKNSDIASLFRDYLTGNASSSGYNKFYDLLESTGVPEKQRKSFEKALEKKKRGEKLNPLEALSVWLYEHGVW